MTLRYFECIGIDKKSLNILLQDAYDRKGIYNICRSFTGTQQKKWITTVFQNEVN